MFDGNCFWRSMPNDCVYDCLFMWLCFLIFCVFRGKKYFYGFHVVKMKLIGQAQLHSNPSDHDKDIFVLVPLVKMSFDVRIPLSMVPAVLFNLMVISHLNIGSFPWIEWKFSKFGEFDVSSKHELAYLLTVSCWLCGSLSEHKRYVITYGLHLGLGHCSGWPWPSMLMAQDLMHINE